MSANIFVTGGSGFVGSAVIDELLARSFTITALINRSPISEDPRVRSVKADLFDANSLIAALAGCEAIIHLVGIIREEPSRGVTFDRMHFKATANLVDAARIAGVRRFIQMSALGVRPGAPSNYHLSKFHAEEYLRQSGLDWTILRPSLIHGPAGEFMQMEAQWAKKSAPPFLFMPYFGAGVFGQRGAGKLQPIYVKDVARAFVDALQNTKTIGEIYPLGGPDPLTWPQLHQTCAQAIVGHQRWTAPIPAWFAKLLTHVVPAPLLPFNHDLILMSQEDNTCDITKFTQAFGWHPQPFAATLQRYAPLLTSVA